MIRRLVMFLLGVLVGLFVGHAIGYQQRIKEDVEQLFMYKLIVNSMRAK